jgi:hypothetical protein
MRSLTHFDMKLAAIILEKSAWSFEQATKPAARARTVQKGAFVHSLQFSWKRRKHFIHRLWH